MNAQVNIGCRDESHPTRLCKVAAFTRTGGAWLPQPHNVPAHLDGDTPIATRHGLARARAAGRLRTVYTLHCRLCGDRVTVRGDRLHPLLDRLAAAAVDYVDLATLRRAIVASTRET